jgi:hypothetical protein
MTMATSAFGVGDYRISKADDKKSDAARNAAAAGAAGGTVTAAAHGKQYAAARRATKEVRARQDPAKHLFSGASSEKDKALLRAAKKGYRIPNKRVLLATGGLAALGGGGTYAKEKLGKSAFGVDDDRISKAGMVGPLGTAIKDTALAPIKGLKPLGEKVKTKWGAATPNQKLATVGAGSGVLGIGLGRKSKN